MIFQPTTAGCANSIVRRAFITPHPAPHHEYNCSPMKTPSLLHAPDGPFAGREGRAKLREELEAGLILSSYGTRGVLEDGLSNIPLSRAGALIDRLHMNPAVIQRKCRSSQQMPTKEYAGFKLPEVIFEAELNAHPLNLQCMTSAAAIEFDLQPIKQGTGILTTHTTTTPALPTAFLLLLPPLQNFLQRNNWPSDHDYGRSS
ncbi:hypothetical protein GALMADRAFT_139069 [Galerina marginata CBS 339.88]|uniref:Uncharacterized protein n=1 Tax=Galerina marginata (strain CBS 339.88) TaxID=685588 RepID=A0A067T1I9_GALM3|nr:hypothetical protein GALMADRAFT_139069 [Galerina marginata CBS 339.88]